MLGVAQGLAEHVIPGLPHQPQERGGIPLDDGLVAAEFVRAQQTLSFGLGLVLVLVLEFPSDEPGESFPEMFERFADALLIGESYRSQPGLAAHKASGRLAGLHLAHHAPNAIGLPALDDLERRGTVECRIGFPEPRPDGLGGEQPFEGGE